MAKVVRIVIKLPPELKALVEKKILTATVVRSALQRALDREDYKERMPSDTIRSFVPYSLVAGEDLAFKFMAVPNRFRPKLYMLLSEEIRNLLKEVVNNV